VSIATQLTISDLPENLTLEEVNDKLAELMTKWRGNYRAECVAEGRAEGRREILVSQAATLLEMLNDRFGADSAHIRHKLSQVSDTAILGQLTRAVYKEDSLEKLEELMANLTPSLTN